MTRTTGRYPNGAAMLFTYNCDMSDDSEHVMLRDRSPCTVIVVGLDDVEPGWDDSTRDERDEAAMPWTYTVRFSDGFEHSAFEDELTESQQ